MAADNVCRRQRSAPAASSATSPGTASRARGQVASWPIDAAAMAAPSHTAIGARTLPDPNQANRASPNTNQVASVSPTCSTVLARLPTGYRRNPPPGTMSPNPKACTRGETASQASAKPAAARAR